MAKNAGKAGAAGSASADFEQATPKSFTRAGGNPATVKALSAVERRAAKLKAKAVEHARRFQDRWTAKEAIRIWQKRLEQQAKHPAPPGEERTVFPEEVLKLASRAVQSRTARRLATINGIKARMSNTIVRNMDSPKLTRAFTGAAGDPAPKPERQQRRQP
ncbi:hypothetical protein [Siccirubricoccus phaeus]|uniref:hypothetical protein n=1 Tax=Siccirubricoccus phaeus TaxID=2595053 RepID=UPI0011F27669|nr:hypothetical protein [Siccirubricoccus phaeus]